MDEKKLLRAHDELVFREVQPQRSQNLLAWCFKVSCSAFIVFSAVTFLGLLFPPMTIDTVPVQKARPWEYIRHKASKPSLEVHIMSKCPDARDCLKELVVPAMINISEHVDFKLSYVGRVTEPGPGVECKHGPSECLGNIIELCAAYHYPDPKIYLGFTMCLTNDLSHIPQRELVDGCALEHGIDFGTLNECASKDDGEFGIKLLQDSIKRTADANVTLSCTVRLNDRVRCIRDGGEWKDCEDGHEPSDLVRDVNSLYEG